MVFEVKLRKHIVEDDKSSQRFVGLSVRLQYVLATEVEVIHL